MWLIRELIPGLEGNSQSFLFESIFFPFMAGYATYMCLHVKSIKDFYPAGFEKALRIVYSGLTLLLLCLFTFAFMLRMSVGTFEFNWLSLIAVMIFAVVTGATIGKLQIKWMVRRYQKKLVHNG